MKTEKQERTAVAKQRSNVYGLLATVFRKEVTSELLQEMKAPQFMGVLYDLGIDVLDDLSQRPEEEFLDDLAVEYARLFLGPGKHISPHESVHHQREDGRWGQLWGETTVEVKRFIESAGLHYRSEYTGLPDHISVELEFMQQLTGCEAQAWADNDEEKALYCRKIEKRFVEDHLGSWIPVFCDRITQEADLSFYRGMAKLTKHFMEVERQEIE
jgi:TorA maturation chaperone TorD